MKRALLISIRPEWAEKILNGKKTIEIRTWIPKDYAGWVYVYVTKDNYKNHLYKKDDILTLTDKHIYHYPYKNICGKVAFRFWYEKVDKIENLIFGCAVLGVTQNYLDEIMKKSCLSINQLAKYLNKRDGYVWHIDKLEIFDKPKELSEFYHYKKKLIDCGMDCPPYVDEVKAQLTKAPQKCVWVYIDEQPKLREPKVLDEETPDKKDDERKPF